MKQESWFKSTWCAYAEFAGGYVDTIVSGTDETTAKQLAEERVRYDANEMAEPVEVLSEDEFSKCWMTAGTLVTASREWKSDDE